MIQRLFLVLCMWSISLFGLSIEERIAQAKKVVLTTQDCSVLQQQQLYALLQNKAHTFAQFQKLIKPFKEKPGFEIESFTLHDMYIISLAQFLQKYLSRSIQVLQVQLADLEYYNEQHTAGRLQAWYQKLMVWFSGSGNRHELYRLHAQKVQQQLAIALGQCVALQGALKGEDVQNQLLNMLKTLEQEANSTKSQDTFLPGYTFLETLEKSIIDAQQHAQTVLEEFGVVFTRPKKIAAYTVTALAAGAFAVYAWKHQKQMCEYGASVAQKSKSFFNNHIIEPVQHLAEVAFDAKNASDLEKTIEQDKRDFYASVEQESNAEELRECTIDEIRSRDQAIINQTRGLTLALFPRYTRNLVRFILGSKIEVYEYFAHSIDKKLKLIMACLYCLPAGAGLTYLGVSFYKRIRNLPRIRKALRSMLHVLLASSNMNTYEICGWLYLYQQRMQQATKTLPWQVRQHLLQDVDRLLQNELSIKQKMRLLKTMFVMYPELTAHF